MNTDIMRQVMVETQAGQLIFPEVVRRLMEAGVESYFCDLAVGRETFYLVAGETYVEKMTLPIQPVAADFFASELVAAIRGAQADKVRYPEFVQRSTAAGVVGYWAFLTGRKVMYFGRKGEVHVEEFPKARD